MLRVVRARGNAEERGRTIGRELRDLIEASLVSYREQLARYGVDPDELGRLLAPYRRAAEERLPELVAQLAATATAAGVAFDELFAVNAWEELDQLLGEHQVLPAAAERCSTFTAIGDGTTLLGHSEHWVPSDVDNVAVIVESPDDGPAVASPTVACCLPATGLNAHGLAQGIDSLTDPDDQVGVPRVLVSRHALSAADREDAVRRADLRGRAGGYAHAFALRGGEAFTVETTAKRVAVLAGPGPHTNHYLDDDLAAVAAGPAGHESSARHRRLAELLAERPPRSPDEAMELLRDDGVAPLEDSQSAVVFACVCEVESGRMWVAAGDPREERFAEIDLADVV
jgi:hypothetical protein